MILCAIAHFENALVCRETKLSRARSLADYIHNFHNCGLQKETMSKSPLKFVYPMVPRVLKMRLYGLKQGPWQMVPKVQIIYEVIEKFLNK